MPVTESASWVRIRTVPYKTMTLDEVCRRGGFASESELRSLLLRVPVESWLQRDDYARWALQDGTKEGLLRLINSDG